MVQGFSLAGKVAIVTGAGSQGPGFGTGKAMSVLFAREGARVCLVDIDLGGESGFELARRLGPARVIMISTHAASDYEDLIEASPAIGVLDKAALSAAAVRELLRLPPETE